MSRIELKEMKCPSCTAPMPVSAGQSQLECLSCGNRSSVIIPNNVDVTKYESDLQGDKKAAFENIISILVNSMTAGNYSEAYNYCNKGLEINPKVGELWENKAICAFWTSVSFLYEDKIVNTNAREIVAFLAASKQHDPDSTTYQESADAIGTNLGQIIILKANLISPDSVDDKTKQASFSLMRQNTLKDYLDTLETAFDIQVNKDTVFLKYIVNEYSNLGKMNWIKKEGGIFMNNSQLTFDPVKKRELIIKKIQQIEPGYVPPEIKIQSQIIPIIIGLIVGAFAVWMFYTTI